MNADSLTGRRQDRYAIAKHLTRGREATGGGELARGKGEGRRLLDGCTRGHRTLHGNVIVVPDTHLLPARAVKGVGAPTTENIVDTIKHGQTRSRGIEPAQNILRYWRGQRRGSFRRWRNRTRLRKSNSMTLTRSTSCSERTLPDTSIPRRRYRRTPQNPHRHRRTQNPRCVRRALHRNKQRPTGPTR